MNWSNNNLLELTYGMIKKHSNKQKRLMKKLCRTHTPAICSYCGGIFKRLDFCVYNKTYNLCCQLCHIIVNFNISDSKKIKIYDSKLSQLEIIRKTSDYIYLNRKFPSIEDIDINASIINIKSITFFEEKTDKKIFFTDQIDLSKIILNGTNPNDDFTFETSETPEEPIDIVSLRKIETTERICRIFKKINEQHIRYDNLFNHF